MFIVNIRYNSYFLKVGQIIILYIFAMDSIHNLSLFQLVVLLMLLGEVFEQTITVDGERATVTLLDMWDSQVTLLVCLQFILI